ncbi:MAG: alpha/beta fold hydrolase [Novosphingobium sp.]|nr:alpha/beta fold hydrolase [Novosphingobium sp.]
MTAAITRHYLTLGSGASKRRVHYRRAGTGPELLLVHQSPRSGGEYEELMQRWGAHFTCIAPDTPGFGQSEPLAKASPDINDYADAIVEFIAAMGLEQVPAYGFHSGAIILITALKRHPQLFSGIAAGGYGVWTEAEKAAFGANYTPPFLPLPYGEHLVWAWNRILEQAWFFPWYDARNETRMRNAHDDPARVHDIIMEILDAGDSFRHGYAAVLAASRDIPPPDSFTAPVFITAYDGDPMQAHIDRLGEMPASWSAQKVRTPDDQTAVSLEFLQTLPTGPSIEPKADGHQGFITVSTPSFTGQLHWRRAATGAQDVLQVHGPGEALDCIAISGTAIDLPGHGLSSPWPGEAPTDWAPWAEVIAAARAALGVSAVALPPVPLGDPARLFPDFTPDRFGAYLTRAWSIARARHFFAPWYEGNAAHAIPFAPEDIALDRLATECRALVRASAASQFAIALQNKG